MVLHAVTINDFIAVLDTDTGKPIEDNGLSGSTEPAATAEWIWEAKSTHKDYHANMDGVGFEWWLENRLISAFEAQHPGKKLILVSLTPSLPPQTSSSSPPLTPPSPPPLSPLVTTPSYL
jgi:hypothetical protein